MPKAVILSGVRTPVGRYGGGLAEVRPDDLAALATSAAVERTRSGFRLQLDEPAYGVAAGQAAVLYEDDAVVGAGLVASSR